MANGGTRRDEILDVAGKLVATAGVRTSLLEIADACGILPGSLYHHFESKEALVGELVRRYRDDLEQVAARALSRLESVHAPIEERIHQLGNEIAECAVRHRAALLLTFFDIPATDGVMAVLPAGTPPDLQAAMLATLRAPGSSDYFRNAIDLPTLADRICQSMLHVGIGVYHEMLGASRVPSTKIRLLLHGVASTQASSRSHNSDAWRAAWEAVASWADRSSDSSPSRPALIRSVARAEFARRGFDTTTIRDIAAAAGVSTGAVYRMVESKDELLLSIMLGYLSEVERGWKSITQADASVVDKLEALLWFNVNIVQTFREEHRIQATWLRDSPPTTPNLPMTFPGQLRQIRTLLSSGVRSGELSTDPVGLDLRARCLLSVIWTPENIVTDLGVQPAFDFAAGTVVRGAAVRRQHVA